MEKLNKKSTVEPIREWDMIVEIKQILKEENRHRDLLMFTLGLNFALRISDLLKIRVSDVFDLDMFPKNRLRIREEKTGKENVLSIVNGSKDALIEFRDNTNLQYSDEYLFKSRIGDKAITRIQAYRIIRELANRVGLKDINIGTHTMRKTWGYHAYKRFDLSLDNIMLKLNHQSIQSTKRYIGLTAEEKLEIESVVSF